MLYYYKISKINYCYYFNVIKKRIERENKTKRTNIGD